MWPAPLQPGNEAWSRMVSLTTPNSPFGFLAVIAYPVICVDCTQMPWGSSSYVVQHLHDLSNKLERRLEALFALIDTLGRDSEAAHVSLYVARINLQTRFVHLWRYLPWQVTVQWTLPLQILWVA